MKITHYLISLALIPTLSLAEQYATIKVHLDQVMQPQSITDTAQSCLQNPACKAIIDGAAAWVGLPAGTDKMLSAIALVPRAERKGEESWFSYDLPQGYSYCKSKVDVISLVPLNGPRGAILGVDTTARGLAAYTWTPRMPLGEGRSWVEADFTIVGISDADATKARAEKRCSQPGKQLTSCRGNGTGDRAGCASFQDM